MSQLSGYDKDNIAPNVIAAIRPFLDRKEFEPEVRSKRAGLFDMYEVTRPLAPHQDTVSDCCP
jgi:hypothetical protein